MSWISIAHHLPEWTRLLCPSVRKNQAACEALADALSSMTGVREVKVRPYTASAVIVHAQDVPLQSLIEIA
ncbi:MAG: hypothetical protein H6Q90_3880 [Deltaproteobacteria bacterium]|nr:hypothetical protein [Deltaproteobacteria bacterium]